MRFNVKKRASYTLDESAIKLFKEKMLDYFKNEMYESGELKEDEDFSYAIDDISDDIVRESLADTVQYAFEDSEYYRGGIWFDDYFNTISLDFKEDDVSDAVYEAVAAWKIEMEV